MLFLLFVVLLSGYTEQHYIYLPVVNNGQFFPQETTWVVHGVQPGPPVSVGSRETLEENSSENSGRDISVEQSHLNPDDTQAHENPEGSHGSSPDVNGPNKDGTYSFSFKSPDQSRSEKSDANGNVEGEYSYTGSDGNVVKVTYKAGAGIGFVPVGEGLQPPPPQGGHPGDSQEPEPDDSQAHKPVPDDSQSHQPEPDDSQSHQPEPDDSQAPEPDDSQSQHPQPEEGGTKHPGGKKGMPYSYNYKTDLSSKTETADDDGNVEGQYTYVDGAGVTRTVKYTVKGDEGFVAQGDIYPDAGSNAPAGKDHSVNTKGTPPVVTKGASPHVPNKTPPKGGKGDRKGINPHQLGKGTGWNKYPLGG